jgi:signal transduction histidine kinase
MVYRSRRLQSLRFQLIAIVVVTVASVLAVSQWLDTSFSERVLSRNVRERALLALDAVDSLWGRSDQEALTRTLHALVAGSREVAAIDVFPLGEAVAGTSYASSRPTITTRSDPATVTPPAASDVARLQLGSRLTSRIETPQGEHLLRLSMPLRRDGQVAAAARADVSLAEVESLQSWLRLVDRGFLVASTLAISLALAFFLERRVTRPVAALVGGMRRAEGGELGARVALAGGGEFAFLGGALDRMLARLEELTAGLEARVLRATGDLAEKNRELQDANEQLWQAQLEIGRSERLAALGQLAATIAHELGTPLNSILGYTQLLRRETLLPEQAEKLAIVESQVRRMIETIRSVLDRTRDRPIVRVPVAVSALVREVVTLVSARLQSTAVRIRTEVPAGLPPLPADAVAVRQVLLNLLANAIDASEPAGAVSVNVQVAAPNGRPGRRLEIAIHDSGPGIGPDVLPRIFDPFYTTKGPGRGTGLGLAIVEHIVRAHGGEVVVDTTPGSGTTMRVRLPLEV